MLKTPVYIDIPEFFVFSGQQTIKLAIFIQTYSTNYEKKKFY